MSVQGGRALGSLFSDFFGEFLQHSVGVLAPAIRVDLC